MSFLANRNVQIFNSTMSVSTLNTSAMAISTLTGSSLTASTISVSTLNTNATNFSTLTGSTLTTSTISVSTLNTSNANFSTLTGSTMTASSIIGSTLSISTLTGSTLTASRIGYSTLSGSSIISNDLVISTLTVSSINNGAPGVGAYSTFNASSINVNSTLTASTINGSTINLSTLNTSNANVSTLTTSTLSVSTMTGSTLTISRLTGLIITASTISASSMTSGDLVLSTLTVSSINGLPPGTGSGGSGGTTIFSTLGVSSLNARSTITTSTLIATANVGIGSNTPNAPLDVAGQIRTATTANNCVMAMTSGNGSFGSIESFNSGNTAKLPIALNAYGGNIGIGMTNPGYLLDVNGTLNIRGSFTVNGTAVATGTGSVWTVGASNCIYYSAGNTCLYRNRLVFSNAINDFNHSIFNNSSNWDGEGVIDGFKYNGYACHWFRVGNASGAVPTTAMFMNNSGQTVIGNTTDAQSNMLRVFGGNSTSGISLGDYMTSSGVKYIGITAVSNGTNVAASSGFSGITFGSPYDGGGTSGYLAFHTHGYGISSDERMRIDKGGKVGIGKTNPSQLLDVNGAINCTSFLVNGTAVATGTGSVWGVNGSSAYYTSGNVGISTTTPNTNLNIRVGTYSSPVLIVDAGGQGTDITPPRGIGKPLIGVGANSWSNVSSGDYYGIGFGYNANNNAASYYPGEIGFLIQSTAGGEYGDMVFSTRPTTTNTTIASERMRITSAGNVGIGTTSVSYPFDLYNSSAILARFQNPGDYARIVLDGATGTGGDIIFKAAGVSKYGIACISGKLQFLLNDSTGTIPMTLDTSGNVGIGTATPAYLTSLSSSAFINLEINRTSAGTNYGAGIIHSLTSSTGSFRGEYAFAFGGATTIATSAQTQAYGYYGVDLANAGTFATNTVGYTGSYFFVTTSSACFPKTNVGIGTASPGYKLQVYSTTANDGILFQNAYNTSTGSIGLFTSTAAGNFILDGTADAGIILPTGGKDLFLSRTTSLYTSMVVKGGTGYVGITTPTPNTYLCVGPNGGVNQSTNIPGISMTSVSGQNMHFSVGQGTAGTNNVFLKWQYNATASAGYGGLGCYGGYNPIVLQEGGGNVGINTTSPTYPLSVVGTIQAISTTNDTMGLFSTTYGGYLHIGAWVASGASSKHVVLQQMGGSVGIGITNPGFPLHVYTGNAGTLGLEQSSTDPNYVSFKSNGLVRGYIGLENSGGGGLFGSNTGYGLSMGTNANGGGLVAFSVLNTIRMNIGTVATAPFTDNAYSCGYSSNRWTYVYAVNGAIQTSDPRRKIINPLPYGLAELLQVQPIKYKWKEEFLPKLTKEDIDNDVLGAYEDMSSFEYYGVNAEEVHAIFPELVYHENPNQDKGLNYGELVPVCINAIKELHATNQEQTARITALETANATLQSQLDAVLARLTAAGI